MKKMKKKKRLTNIIHKNWKIVFIVGILVLLVLLFLPKIKILSFFSHQGTIDVKHLTGEYESGKTQAFFNNKPVQTPQYQTKKEPIESVLGQSNSSKRIEVDLTNQRLYAYEGDQKIYDFLVSSGKWGWTPTGNFKIWIKLRYTLMTGGSKALGTYYYLPNVPFTMFFYNDKVSQWQGFGIHGTYWHNNFGHPMSHGCINMKTEEVEKLYYWAPKGIDVVIYGTTPEG